MANGPRILRATNPYPIWSNASGTTTVSNTSSGSLNQQQQLISQTLAGIPRSYLEGSIPTSEQEAKIMSQSKPEVTKTERVTTIDKCADIINTHFGLMQEFNLRHYKQKVWDLCFGYELYEFKHRFENMLNNSSAKNVSDAGRSILDCTSDFYTWVSHNKIKENKAALKASMQELQPASVINSLACLIDNCKVTYGPGKYNTGELCIQIGPIICESPEPGAKPWTFGNYIVCFDFGLLQKMCNDSSKSTLDKKCYGLYWILHVKSLDNCAGNGDYIDHPHAIINSHGEFCAGGKHTETLEQRILEWDFSAIIQLIEQLMCTYTRNGFAKFERFNKNPRNKRKPT